MNKLVILMACFALIGSLSAAIVNETTNTTTTQGTCGSGDIMGTRYLVGASDVNLTAARLWTGDTNTNFVVYNDAATVIYANVTFTNGNATIPAGLILNASTKYLIAETCNNPARCNFGISGTLTFPLARTHGTLTNGYSGAANSTTNSYGVRWFTVEDITAAPIETFANLTVLCGTGGATCTGNATDINTTTGANRSINATAAVNYTFANWTITGGNCTIANSTDNTTTANFLNTTASCTVQANFNYTPLANLTVLCGTGGASCLGNATNFIIPSNRSINATAAVNYTFANWTITGGNCTIANSTDNTTTANFLNSTSSCTIQANFIYAPPKVPHAIQVPDPHVTGTISLLGFMNTITGGIFGIGIIIALSIIIFMSLFDRGFEEALLVASIFADLISILCAWMGIVSPLWIVLFLAITCVAVILNMKKRG
jgi:hypothetical protein